MSAGDEERLARLALNAVTEPGDLRVARLVAALGAVEVYERLRADLDLDGVRRDAAARLESLAPAGRAEAALRRGVRFVVPGDDEWPAGLDDLTGRPPVQGMGGAPLGLWVSGPLMLAESLHRSVALVGARSATTYGTQVARDLAAELGGQGFAVVSGAAFGIDQAAHRGAIAAGAATVAVLACGVDRAYPAAHRELLRHVRETSLVVSELPLGCAPTRVRFLGRNRLIAALTQGTVVVEAAARSGALNTANWASGLGRVVMGVPGPVTSAPSAGVHELIRTGAATLVTRGEHVLELLSPAGEQMTLPLRGPDSAYDRLAQQERRVLDAVPLRRAAPPESIARAAGLAVDSAEESLRRLGGAGWVEHVPSGWRRATQGSA